LLDYAEKHREIETLLREVEQINPRVFCEYANRIYQKTRFSQINNEELRAINHLVEFLNSLRIDQLEPIYWQYKPSSAPVKVDNKYEMLTELNRLLPSQQYRPIAQFVHQIKQDFPQLTQNLENWRQQYGNLFGYDEFLSNPPSTLGNPPAQNTKTQSSLLIVVDQIESDFLEMRAWFWSVERCRSIQEATQIQLLSDEFDQVKRYKKLSEKVSELIESSNKLMREIGSEDLRVELFLPTQLIQKNDCYLDWIEIKRLNFTVKLCQQYPVIFRLAERLETDYQDLIGNWKRKWKQLLNNPVILPYSPDIAVQLSQPQTSGMILDSISHHEDFLRLICLNAIPIALWSRRDLPSGSSLQEINRILEKIRQRQDFQQLPQEIKNERNAAQTQTEHIGHHICLLWDDPERMPPNETQPEYSFSPL